MKKALAGLVRAVPTFLRDATGLAGAGSIAYGAWLLHPAAGFIIGGVLALGGAFLAARSAGRE